MRYVNNIIQQNGMDVSLNYCGMVKKGKSRIDLSFSNCFVQRGYIFCLDTSYG